MDAQPTTHHDIPSNSKRQVRVVMFSASSTSGQHRICKPFNATAAWNVKDAEDAIRTRFTLQGGGIVVGGNGRNDEEDDMEDEEIALRPTDVLGDVPMNEAMYFVDGKMMLSAGNSFNDSPTTTNKVQMVAICLDRRKNYYGEKEKSNNL
jgi:hypothetical protein